jgi:hypothetical protein
MKNGMWRGIIIVYIGYQSACPFVGIGSPSPQCVPPLDPKGWGATLPWGWGGGLTQFERLEREPRSKYTEILSDGQGVTKRCRLSWLTNNALVYGGEGGEVRVLSQWVQLSIWSPKKLWRSNSMFNLWWWCTREKKLFRLLARWRVLCSTILRNYCHNWSLTTVVFFTAQ